MDGYKVTEIVKVFFTRGEYYEEVLCDVIPMDFCHLCLGDNWFNKHRVPNEQNWSNYVVYQWGTHLFPLPKV